MNNLLFSNTNSVFGLCVKRCNIRKIHGNIENIDSDGFDQNQESALLPFSPVLILNKWNNYYYIKTHVARGWVDADSIAILNRQQTRELFYPDSFCIITEPTVTLCGKEFYMSCKIPLINNMLQIPYIDGENLYFKSCPLKEGCHIGYLTFSRKKTADLIVRLLLCIPSVVAEFHCHVQAVNRQKLLSPFRLIQLKI